MMAAAKAQAQVVMATEGQGEPERQSARENGRVVRIPKMLSVRTVSRALGRDRRWVFSMCQASKIGGAPWPGTCMVGNAWRIPEQSIIEWWARSAAMPVERARLLLDQASRGA